MSISKDALRSPLGRVKALGSAKDGTGHWIAQRVSALALIPLTAWCVYSLLTLVLQSPPGQAIPQEAVADFFANFWHALGMVLLLGALFYHAHLGLQVVIEDYVHCHTLKLLALLKIKFLAIVLAAISILAVLKLHFLDVLSYGV